MSAKEAQAVLDEMGLDGAGLAAEMKRLVKVQTVTTGEGGKKLEKAIGPNADEKKAIASTLLAHADLRKVEGYILEQIASLA